MFYQIGSIFFGERHFANAMQQKPIAEKIQEKEPNQ